MWVGGWGTWKAKASVFRNKKDWSKSPSRIVKITIKECQPRGPVKSGFALATQLSKALLAALSGRKKRRSRAWSVFSKVAAFRHEGAATCLGFDETGLKIQSFVWGIRKPRTPRPSSTQGFWPQIVYPSATGWVRREGVKRGVVRMRLQLTGPSDDCSRHPICRDFLPPPPVDQFDRPLGQGPR